jgi:hypothetical protein
VVESLAPPAGPTSGPYGLRRRLYRRHALHNVALTLAAASLCWPRSAPAALAHDLAADAEFECAAPARHRAIFALVAGEGMVVLLLGPYRTAALWRSQPSAEFLYGVERLPRTLLGDPLPGVVRCRDRSSCGARRASINVWRFAPNNQLVVR